MNKKNTKNTNTKGILKIGMIKSGEIAEELYDKILELIDEYTDRLNYFELRGVITRVEDIMQEETIDWRKEE